MLLQCDAGILTSKIHIFQVYDVDCCLCLFRLCSEYKINIENYCELFDPNALFSCQRQSEIVPSGVSGIFLRRGHQLPKWDYFCKLFAENCMKMKEFGPPAGARPWRPPWIRQWFQTHRKPVLG